MTTDPNTPPPANSVAALLQEGMAALNAKDFAQAEPLLREAFSQAPLDISAYYCFALLLHRTGRSTEAEQILLPATQRGTQPRVIMLLAEIFEKSNRLPAAAQCYDIILKSMPQDYSVLINAAHVRKKLGESAVATEFYRRAMEAKPNDFAATEKYAEGIWEKDPQRSVEIRENLLAAVGSDLIVRSQVLQSLLSNKEQAERMKRGQMPYHVASIDEILFVHGRAYAEDFEATWTALAKANPASTQAQMALGYARFAVGDRPGADAQFQAVADQHKDGVALNIRLAPAFYDELRTYTHDDLVRGLPPLLNVTPLCPDPAGTLYLSCNFYYFRAFTLPMIVSLREHSPKTPVHIHLMDANESEVEFALAFLRSLAPLKFAVSVERPMLQNAAQMEARCYYHAIRFIRLLEHLEAYKSPLWLMDVDALINRDLEGLFAQLNGRDIAVRVRPGRLEPWNQFNACVVGAAPTGSSREYLRLIAGYIAHFYQKSLLRWGIDQLAMYGVFTDMRDHAAAPTLMLLDDHHVDYTYFDDGYVWCNSGAGKFQHLQRVSKPDKAAPLEFPDNRFVVAFERYWQECEQIVARLGIKP